MMGALELDKAGKLVADPSVTVYEDGHCYDFGRGGVYYPTTDALIKARPELRGGLSDVRTTDGMSKAVTTSTHDYPKVSSTATQMKQNITADILAEYLPFYDYKRIHSNVGAIKGNLAVMMWKPTSGGSKPGNHYGIVQYRGDSRAKWMSVKGSDAKTVESMVTDDGAVYVTFGMGDFLLLKSMGLNYLCFAGDNGAKNSPYAEYMKKKVGTRPIRLIADNDTSGEETANYLRSYGFAVSVFSWKKLSDLVKHKWDLRDLANIIKVRGGDMDDLLQVITQRGFYE